MRHAVPVTRPLPEVEESEESAPDTVRDLDSLFDLGALDEEEDE